MSTDDDRQTDIMITIPLVLPRGKKKKRKQKANTELIYTYHLIMKSSFSVFSTNASIEAVVVGKWIMFHSFSSASSSHDGYIVMSISILEDYYKIIQL